MQKMFPRRRLKRCIEGEISGKLRIVAKSGRSARMTWGVAFRNFLITLDRSRYRVLIRALKGIP